jgi:hypothetical protein
MDRFSKRVQFPVLALFLIACAAAFGQDRLGVGSNGEYGAQVAMRCHSYIKVSARTLPYTDGRQPQGNLTLVRIEFENTSDKPVTFHYVVSRNAAAGNEVIQANKDSQAFFVGSRAGGNTKVADVLVADPKDFFVNVGKVETTGSTTFGQCAGPTLTPDDFCFLKPEPKCPGYQVPKGAGKEPILDPTKNPATGQQQNPTNITSTGMSAEAIKQKIVENLKANIKPVKMPDNVGFMAYSDIAIDTNGSTITIKYRVQNERGSSENFTDTISYANLAQNPSYPLQGPHFVYNYRTAYPDSRFQYLTGIGAGMSLPYDTGPNDQNFNELKALAAQLTGAPSTQPGATTTANGSPRISPVTNVTSKWVLTNRTADPVNVYWMDYQGQEKLYVTLQPGNQWVCDTFVGHIWRIRSPGSQQLIRELVIQGSPQDDVIR